MLNFNSKTTCVFFTGRKRRPSIGYKVAALVGLTRKSNSTTQIGKKNKNKTSFQRSEEVGAPPELLRNRVSRQTSKESNDGSIGSISSDSSNVLVSAFI